LAHTAPDACIVDQGGAGRAGTEPVIVYLTGLGDTFSTVAKAQSTCA